MWSGRPLNIWSELKPNAELPKHCVTLSEKKKMNNQDILSLQWAKKL